MSKYSDKSSVIVPKSMEKMLLFVYNPSQILQGLLLCPRAKQIILQEVNCLILKELNKSIVTDLEKITKLSFQGLFFCLLILVV